MTRPWEASRLQRLAGKCAMFRGKLERLERRAGRRELSERDRRAMQRLNGQLESAEEEYRREYREWIQERRQAGAP